MHYAIRTQQDRRGDEYGKKTALDCSQSKDMARQEFKDEADINIMLKRFGVMQQQRTTVPFGEADYTIDLQSALHSINDTQRAYARMDPEIRKIYPSYQKFVQGVMSGSVKNDLERIKKEKETAPATTATVPEEKPKTPATN